MDKQLVASLGCKFLGIYALLESIPLFGNIFQTYAFASGEPAFGMALILSTSIPFVLLVSSAIALIVFSNKFANKMIDLEGEENSGQTITFKDLQSIAFSVVGLVLLLLSLPKMVQIGCNIYAVKAAGDERNVAEIVRNTWSFALATGIQFVIGFVLFIGADLFSTLWYKSVKRLKHERNIT